MRVEEEAKENRSRLLSYGLSSQEIQDLHSKISNMSDEVEIDAEVKDIILQMSIKAVQKSIEFSCELAALKQDKTGLIEVEDVKFYMENVLGLNVPGYPSSAFNNVASTDLYPESQRAAHLQRMKLKK